jgi:hypothetical protein
MNSATTQGSLVTFSYYLGLCPHCEDYSIRFHGVLRCRYCGATLGEPRGDIIESGDVVRPKQLPHQSEEMWRRNIGVVTLTTPDLRTVESVFRCIGDWRVKLVGVLAVFNVADFELVEKKGKPRIRPRRFELLKFRDPECTCSKPLSQ